MRILFLTGRELSYPRNSVMLRALERFAQVETIAPVKPPRSLLRSSASVIARAVPRLLLRSYDLVFVGFYGHLIVRALAPLIRSPLLFDAFVSTYDTLCFDRQIFAPDSWRGRAAYHLDRTVVQRASHVLLDTPQHVDYFVETFSVSPHKFSALPVGCQDQIFQPQEVPTPTEQTRVLYYSTYMPLHGVETIVWAAAHLSEYPIHFRLIGDGPLFAQVRALAVDLGLTNVEFVSTLSLQELAEEIALADICLGGHFGSSAKAERVVPGKIYQMLAVGRPIVAADTPANRSLLAHNESAYFVPSGDPMALVRAITTLHGDAELRARLASGGRALYQTECSEEVIAKQLRGIVSQLTGAQASTTFIPYDA